MKRSRAVAVAVGLAALAVLATSTFATADDHHGRRNVLTAKLKGFEEVPAISTTGTGTLRLKISKDESSIDFDLTYQDLEGATTLFSHIHLGQTSVNGGVAVFFCGGGGRPDCTPGSGTFTGTITAADIVGPTAQGLAPGEFAELIRALRAGKTYVNVHTDIHPGGEIRGQITHDADDD